ncbi:type II secretion system protein GspL [Sphingomonas sp. R86521]|uniref:type II secretion system protein GspL n=1 Tax=Sphingomonas sp. R86521 TaxID=3093860 RepID=UPI0036D3161B
MTTLLFLPAGETGYRWMRVVDARIADEGEGLPLGDDPVVAVAPAEDVTLHWAELPSRSPAQATAAARLLVAEASAAPLAELHVAVGDEGRPDRPIGVVGAGLMGDWLAALAAEGIDPVAVVPAPMLLPQPAEGYARAEIAGVGVVRGTSSGFADDALLTPLITGGVAPVMVSPEALADALVAAAGAPALDLRQGPFARRRRFALDWALIRRLAMLALLILAVTLAISLVRIAKYSFGADALEAQADAIARTGLPRGETVTDPSRQLDERLSRVRGPGLGFSATTAAVFAAVRATPGTEVTALDFQANGDLRLSVAVEREALATDLKRALESAGFTVRAGTFQMAAGRVTGDLTVTAR